MEAPLVSFFSAESSTPDVIDIKYGMDLDISCNGTGNPIPKITIQSKFGTSLGIV